MMTKYGCFNKSGICRDEECLKQDWQDVMTLGVCKYSQIVLALAQHNNQIIFTLFSVLILNLDLYSIHADTHLMPSKNVSPNAEFLLLFYLYMYIHIPIFIQFWTASCGLDHVIGLSVSIGQSATCQPMLSCNRYNHYRCIW